MIVYEGMTPNQEEVFRPYAEQMRKLQGIGLSWILIASGFMIVCTLIRFDTGVWIALGMLLVGVSFTLIPGLGLLIRRRQILRRIPTKE